MTPESGFQVWRCWECGAEGAGSEIQCRHPWLRFWVARALFSLGTALHTASHWLRWESRA